MQIHLILGLNGEESISALAERLEHFYPGQHLRLPNRPAWLLAEDDLARVISERLGIVTGLDGIAGLVTTVADYYGRAEPEIWAWMKMMYERPASSVLRALRESVPDGVSSDVAAEKVAVDAGA
jgi:hypothetical protein